MMYLLFILSVSSPSHAEGFHLPQEMQQKIDAAGEAVAEAAKHAKRKLHREEEESGLVAGAMNDMGKIWRKVKAKSFSALVYLDHEFHAHVIGSEPAAK